VNCDPRIEKGPELGFKASDQYQLTNSYSHIVSEKIICGEWKRSYFEKSKANSLGKLVLTCLKTQLREERLGIYVAKDAGRST
jgi:hypothetical protein